MPFIREIGINENAEVIAHAKDWRICSIVVMQVVPVIARCSFAIRRLPSTFERQILQNIFIGTSWHIWGVCKWLFWINKESPSCCSWIIITACFIQWYSSSISFWENPVRKKRRVDRYPVSFLLFSPRDASYSDLHRAGRMLIVFQKGESWENHARIQWVGAWSDWEPFCDIKGNLRISCSSVDSEQMSQ